MKKYVSLLFVGLFASTFAMAQESGEYKPAAGAKTVEFIFRPDPAANNFVGALTNSLNQPFLRGRYFTSETMALRAGLVLGFNNSTTYDAQEEKTVTSGLDLGLRPGLEWHFAGTDRFSPYVGADLAINLKSSSAEITPKDGQATKIEGATNAAGANRAGFGFGLNGVIGADYYITKSIYLGIEGSWGFMMMTEADMKVTPPQGNAQTTKGGSSMSFGSQGGVALVGNGGIRLGYKF